MNELFRSMRISLGKLIYFKFRMSHALLMPSYKKIDLMSLWAKVYLPNLHSPSKVNSLTILKG